MATGKNETAMIKTCRYCLTNSIKHIAQYFFTDDQDKFEKILRDTFNIQIFFSENKILCHECREDIKNAAEVKKRVLNVQNILLENSKKLTLLDNEALKEEIVSDYEEWGFECGETGAGEMGAGEMGAGGLGASETASKKEGSATPKKEIQSDCEDGMGDGGKGDSGTEVCGKKDGEVNIRNSDIQNNGHILKKTYIKIERLENEIRSQPKGKTVTKTSDAKSAVKKLKLQDTKPTAKGKCESFMINKSLKQKRENTLFLLNNSNMCLFTPKKNKYSCFICKEIYLDMQKLRAHSLTHKTDKIKRSIIYSQGKNLKTVDISNLSCKKCSHPCADLDELRVHLKNNHDEPFQGTEHLLLPFKIKERLTCVICQKEFGTFIALFSHMNCHSTNHVCEICGVSFNNVISLKQHIKAVHKESKCTICLAVLPTVAAKMKHLRIVHNKMKINERRYCNQCNMVFRYTYKLREHMVEKHGAKKTVSVCEQCNKEFASEVGLKTHFKSVHLGERNHGCSLCNRSFFTTFDKRRHEKTHGNEKPFSCGFCKIKFRSKDSMRRHLRRKHEASKND